LVATQHRDQVNLHTKLERVERRSRQDRKAVFNNIGYLLNLEMLESCYRSLDGTKAVGIDKVTKEEYGKNLLENLKQLLIKIRRGSYHPKASRIVEIPKVDGSTRPLAISCFEDKIVQEAVRQIVERIYEPVFTENSYGFRPGRNCHQAIIALKEHLMGWDCRAVLEMDLRKYFNTIPHEPLIRLLKLKIADERFLHLIIKLLRAPTLNAKGAAERNTVGSPQGSILSPLIANIYLHYVMDIWFSWINGKEYRGKARMVRYADDAAFVFGSFAEAEKFRSELVTRMERFGISINDSKTKVLASGKYEATKHENRGARMPSFTFLGFLFVWGISVNGKTGKRFWRVKTRSCPKRFKSKLAVIKAMIRKRRHDKQLVSHTKRVVEGYLNYFAVTDNLKRCSQFTHEVKRMLYKYLNRRSQRRSFDWERFTGTLKREAFPEVYLRRSLIFDLSNTE
jgi:RNA-directed DNA polymerase